MKVEVAATMEIYFCDLCNESVPEADLSAGRAVRRKERVVCATCEAAMSHPEETTAGASPPPVGIGPAHPAPARVRTVGARRRAAGAGLAVVAILFSAGTGAWLARELERDRSVVAESQRELGLELARAQTLSTQLASALDRRTAALERGLHERLDETGRELGLRISEVRRGIEGFATRLEGLEEQTAGLRRDLDESAGSQSRRLDELTGRLNVGRQDVNFFSDRLGALEEVVQGRMLPIEPPRAAAPQQQAPAWSGVLAALVSDKVDERWNAVQTLGESRDPAVVPHLLPILSDEDVFVRMAVARVLGDLAAPQAIEPLIDALEDDDPAVREMAMISLRSITGRSFKFDAVANPAERAKQVKAWRQWWKKAQEELSPG